MSKYYTTARLLYRLHKITADQVWAYTESDPPKNHRRRSAGNLRPARQR